MLLYLRRLLGTAIKLTAYPSQLRKRPVLHKERSHRYLQ
jgi:hypothetical protein